VPNILRAVNDAQVTFTIKDASVSGVKVAVGIDGLRRRVGEKYAVLLDGLYGGKSVQHIDTKVKFEDGRSGSIAADLKLSDARRFPAVTKAAA